MSEVFDVERWSKWANSEVSLFYTLPDYGRIGFITNSAPEEILIITKNKDLRVKVETGIIQEIKRNPVVDVVFIVKKEHFDHFLNDPKFEKFGKLIRKGYITGNRLITEKDLHKKDYTLFLSALGLSASGGCCGV